MVEVLSFILVNTQFSNNNQAKTSFLSQIFNIKNSYNNLKSTTSFKIDFKTGFKASFHTKFNKNIDLFLEILATKID